MGEIEALTWARLEPIIAIRPGCCADALDQTEMQRLTTPSAN